MSVTPSKPPFKKSLKDLFPNQVPLLQGSKFHARKEKPLSYDPTFSRQAELQLDCLIIGAGLAGLASAIVLTRSGHRVRIYEKRSQAIPEFSCGVRLPPNLTKILYEWGLQLDSSASACTQSHFLTVETNTPVGLFEWKEEILKEAGGDYLMMRYEKLYTMLYEKALSLGVSITCNSHVLSVAFNEERSVPVAHLADDIIHSADLILGADGPTGVVRESITGCPNTGHLSGSDFYSIVVPAEKLKGDPDWGKWVTTPKWPIWMGTNICVLAHPIDNLSQLTAHAWLPSKTASPETWSNLYPTDQIDFTGCHPCIRRLFLMTETAVHTPVVFRTICEDWVDESGTIALVGESAHPLVFFTSQNAALAVEDATVLGGLLSHLSSREQLPQLLEAYQDLRMPRVQLVHETEMNNVTFGTQDDIELQELRNDAITSSMKKGEGWSDQHLRAQLDAIRAEFCYHASEDAEDWWTKWGAMISDRGIRTQFNLTFEVTEVIDVN